MNVGKIQLLHDFIPTLGALAGLSRFAVAKNFFCRGEGRFRLVSACFRTFSFEKRPDSTPSAFKRAWRQTYPIYNLPGTAA
jgi:hypothetical protein